MIPPRGQGNGVWTVPPFQAWLRVAGSRPTWGSFPATVGRLLGESGPERRLGASVRMAPHVASSLLADERGESRWPPVLAVIAAAGLYATLPGRFIAGSAGVI